jgi:hypothetical protein
LQIPAVFLPGRLPALLEGFKLLLRGCRHTCHDGGSLGPGSGQL